MMNGGGGTDNGGDFRMSAYEMSGRFREQRERLIPRLGFDLHYYDFHSNDPVIPKGLTETSFAAGVELGTYYNWRAGLTVGVGYAGDSPFGQSNAWYEKATLVVGRKLDPKTDVAVVLDYDGNRTIWPDIPIPGAAYRHEFDPTLSYTLGVPLSSVTWKPQPIPELTVEVTYLLVDSFDAKVDYSLSPHWALFGAMETRQEGFHVDGIGGHDRLFFEQRRAEAGVRWVPRKYTSLTAALGYAWGGSFSRGWSLSESDPVADDSDEPYVRLGFETRF
jgi:hypothetical protein